MKFLRYIYLQCKFVIIMLYYWSRYIMAVHDAQLIFMYYKDQSVFYCAVFYCETILLSKPASSFLSES